MTHEMINIIITLLYLYTFILNIIYDYHNSMNEEIQN
jgi:hypothetical protein